MPATAGVHTAYYLVHSMGSGGKFEQEDREAAQNFADVARDSGVQRSSPSFSFCSDSAYRRFEWLVLCLCSLVVSRRSRSSRGSVKRLAGGFEIGRRLAPELGTSKRRLFCIASEC